MAATATNPWNKPGGWALAAEEQEAEELQQQQQLAAAAAVKPIIPESAFPDLAAAQAAPKGKKKSKGQKLSLNEFANYDAAAKQPSAAFQPSRGLTHEEMAVLPTGPRERTAEELANASSRGFRSYGTRDEQPRRRESTFAPPSSRADEIDDWGAAKKMAPASSNGFDRRERREGTGGGFFSDSASRADEVDNWAARKAFVPSDSGRRMPERRSSAFESIGGEGRGDADNWLKRKETTFGSSGGAFDSLRDRRGGSGSSGDSPIAGSGAVERPRLNLQPRTLPVTLPPPVVNVNNNVEQQQNGAGAGEAPVKLEIAPRPKGANPFGNARPREEVLREKGQDPSEIEKKLEAAKLKEEEQRPAFVGKRGFGTGGWRGAPPEDKAWRKPASEAGTVTPTETSRPGSAETRDGAVEEAEDKNEAQA